MAGSPVYITANNGSPVNITGAGANSIPISGIAAPIGSVADQQIATGAGGGLVAAPGFFSSILFHSSIPFIFASTGSMGNNGALSGLTSLVNTYANAYILLPIGAIDGTNPLAAGWYYCTMSSATAGTVFNNTYTSGQPVIPASPTAFFTTGPGAFTGDSSATSAFSYTMPAATLAVNDTIRISFKATTTNTAANKVMTMLFGGSTVGASTVSTIASTFMIMQVSNRGVLTAQIAGFTGQEPQQSVNGFNLLSVNTANSVVIAAQGTNGTPGTNNIIMESLTVELLKGS